MLFIFPIECMLIFKVTELRKLVGKLVFSAMSEDTKWC